MIICMFSMEYITKSNVICVTNRQLCTEDFLFRMEKIAKSGVKAIILREKDMQEADYKMLAKQVMDICKRNNTQCILHSFISVAMSLKHKAIHLPMSQLETLSKSAKDHFEILGASCHSVEEAIVAQNLGCTYITAGHVFETECKKGLQPKGIQMIRDISNIISIPVYGLGGITADNTEAVINAGAKGVCIMSGFMK